MFKNYLLTISLLIASLHAASKPIVTTIVPTVVDQSIWRPALDQGWPSIMQTRAMDIDKMKGLFYAAADKELLRQHQLVEALAETLSAHFAKWYYDRAIVIPNPEYKDEYLEILQNSRAQLQQSIASLAKLAKEKTGNAQFQKIRLSIEDQAEELVAAVDRLIYALTNFVR